VRLHRRLTDDEALRDLRIREATRDQRQDLAFPRCQLLDLGGRSPGCLGRAPDELFDHSPRDGGREQRLPGADGADPGYELLRRRVLEQEAARARSQCLVDVLVHVEGRQHDDFRADPIAREQPASRLDPVELGHAHVHEHDVWGESVGLGEGLLAVRRLADHRHVLFGVEDHPEARADERLVVDDQDADPGVGLLGRR
jgi:hypothetical protein